MLMCDRVNDYNLTNISEQSITEIVYNTQVYFVSFIHYTQFDSVKHEEILLCRKCFPILLILMAR